MRLALTRILLSAGLVGTVNNIKDSSFTGWIRLYNLTFIVGLAMSFSVFLTLNYFFPPPGLGEEAPFVDNILYGQEGLESKVDEEAKLETDIDKHVAVAAVSV